MKLRELTYGEAMEALDAGQCVKLPEWHGHWFKKDGKIFVELRDGSIADTPWAGYEHRLDWLVVDGLRNWQSIQYALDAGCMAERVGWNGKFVFSRPKSDLTPEIIARLNPMTEQVRNVLLATGGDVTFSAYYCLWTGKYVSNGWSPSMEDLRSDDWRIIR